MKFHKEVVLFDFAGFPMVGNLENGYLIGLNSNGASICKKLSTVGMALENIQDADALLCEHLNKGGFFQRSSNQQSLSSAYLHVTQRCNLDCLGCYSFSQSRNSLRDPDLNQIKQALKFLRNAGINNLVISGGEPFLRNDLADIIDFAFDGLGMSNISIITNGTVQKQEFLKPLVGKVTQIAVSIDGYSQDCTPYIRKEQRFEDLVATIKSIQAVGINAHIIPTLHKKNYADAPKYAQLAKDLGVTMNFSLLSYPETDIPTANLLPTNKELTELGKISMALSANNDILFRDTPLGLSLHARKNCGLARGMVSIDADGEVYPCHMMHDAQFSFGNAFSDDSESILNSASRTNFCSSSVDHYSECKVCDIRYLCGGGCRARAFYSSGLANGKDSYCEMIKEFYHLYAERIIAAKKEKETSDAG